MAWTPCLLGFSLLLAISNGQESVSPDLTLDTTDYSTYVSQALEYESSVDKALAWLITQRSPDWGWGNHTAKVLLALQLAGASTDKWTVQTTSQETMLSSKQMEIEIVMLLWRHHEVPISPSRLASFTLALNSLCQDPRQFHGHDLIGTLQHHEPQKDLEFAYTALAVCSANAHVRKRQLRRLLDIANTAKDHNIDTVSMVILALGCIVKDHRHRNLQNFVRRPALNLAKQQQGDGGFGNLYTTAVVVQALQEVGGLDVHWNKTRAKQYIESRQDPDGAFTDPSLTADVVLALSWRGLGAIRNLDCNKGPTDALDNHVELDGLTKAGSGSYYNDSEIKNVTITYSLWIGTNVTENYSLTITAPRNISFYNVMQIAADMDPHFSFLTSKWPNGHYVHTLAGYKEEPMGYHYWLLYRVPELPDPMTPPANQLVAPVGVDDLLIDDGEHYLFWYKKL